MTEHKKEDYESYEEPFLVRVESTEEVVHDSSVGTPSHHGSDIILAQDDTSSPPASLASDRQLTGALWAGGILGFVCSCLPVGALVGALTMYSTAKYHQGRIGKFTRKVGDFTTRMGTIIRREWNEVSASSVNRNSTTATATTTTTNDPEHQQNFSKE